MRYIQAGYLAIYNFITEGKVGLKAAEARSIHVHLIATLSTSALMWAYAFTALYTIDSPVPGSVGLVCSLIHLLSPFSFKFTDNILAVTLVMLTAGFTHQGTYAYFTGGFQSHLLIWFGIIPMLAGIIEGFRAILITACLVTTIALTFFVMELTGYPFPNLISQNGRTISQALLVFGWIGLSTILIMNFNRLTSTYQTIMEEQQSKTKILLQILLHDISNRVQAISLLNRYVRINDKTSGLDKIHQDVAKNVNTLYNVIHSVRRMHLLELEKKKMALIRYPIERSVANAVDGLESKLTLKKIEVDATDLLGEVMCDPLILENQILTNILSNCVKFSPEGARIIISSAPSKCGEKIELIIRDQGIGIPPEILDNLFNPRVATTRPGTHSEKGTGLGMIIVKSMVEKMGGNISVDSSTEPNRSGTTFKLAMAKAQK